MEGSAHSFKSQEGDHNYFVSSETVESWKTRDENRLKNTTTTIVNPEMIATSIKKNEDEFEVIEEEVVESLMIEHEEDSYSASRTSADDKTEISTGNEKKVDDGKNSPCNTANIKSTTELSDVSADELESNSKTTISETVPTENDSVESTDVSVKNDLCSIDGSIEKISNEKKSDSKSEIVNISIAENCKENSSSMKSIEDSVHGSGDVQVARQNSLPNTPRRVKYVPTESPVVKDQDVKRDFCSTLEKSCNNLKRNNTDDPNDSENDVSSKVCDSSTMSTASGDDSIDYNNEPDDECDSLMGDTPSSFFIDVSSRSKVSPKKKSRRRQPPIMIGYKKRRKTHHLKKLDDEYDLVHNISSRHNGVGGIRISEGEGSLADERSEGSSHHAIESSSSEENLYVPPVDSSLHSFIRRCSSSTNEPTDKFCWTCHKDSGILYKCLACPRVFHHKCYLQISGIDFSDDPNNFQCPECVAVLRADNVNTRSPTLATVNLDQLCVSLKHVIDLLKAQKDSHHFWGPVDTKEFPHYREYIAHPMDLMMLEKNVSDKIYGCTEAFLADVKWIVHNSIVFNSKASKITNVAKNLLKICKREVAEIETCAECYYNSLVRIDTWFIEVCKRPHMLVWARLKGYPPWPAKALKCKDNMVDCRFFGAHDKAWVPLKDCFLYSKVPPQPTKMKKSNHLEMGIQEIEKHINKLKDKFGIFTYPPARTPYQPLVELDQIRLMLPNFDSKSIGRLSTKYLIHPDRVKGAVKPKALFNDKENASTKGESDIDDEKRLEEADNESTCTDDQDKPLEVPPLEESLDTDISISSSENETSSPAHEWKVDKSDNPVESSHVKNISEKSFAVPESLPNADSNVENTNIAGSKVNESSKPEDPNKFRKFVVVRNIDTINASIINIETKEVAETAGKVSSTSLELGSMRSRASQQAFSTNSQSQASPRSIPPFVTNLQSQSSPIFATLVEKEKESSEDLLKDSADKNRTASKDNELSEFDLDKVKDEPMDVDLTSSDEPINEKHVTKPTKVVQASSPASTRSKRINDEECVLNAVNVKKLKPDSNLRSVNISENVTLSVVNPTLSTNGSVPRITNVKLSGPQKKPIQPVSLNYPVIEGNSETPLLVGKSKFTPPSTGKAVTNSAAVPVSRSQVKILPRPTSISVPLVNGPSLSLKKPPSVTVGPLKVDSTSNPSLINGLDELLYNEYQSHFKKFFEDTIDKIAGKGDHRAKVFSLQKEIESLKKNHDLLVDELKREYEIQIAELRATSIAKTQFDLAAERLKFEQEKEKAVKEAKSKQWCSNCQKSANYYCCWNTAYCDFECQKEHWMNHMHVCKNDVKKKAAESSENEPPRIMMQNDVANNYILNGYEKSVTTTNYSYQNSNAVVTVSRNFKKQNTSKNNIATKANYRPLLPRISSTTNTTNSLLCSPSTSSVSTTHLNNSSPAFLDNTYQTVSSSTTNNSRPHSSVVVRQTTLFHNNK